MAQLFASLPGNNIDMPVYTRSPQEIDAGDSVSLLGQGYSCTTDAIAIPGQLQTDFILISNPSGSGKLVRISEQFFGIQHKIENSTFRVYINPTVTGPGTPLGVNKNRPSMGAASVLAVSSLPIIAARGKLLFCTNVTPQGSLRTMQIPRYLEAGSKLLVTVQGTANSISHFFSQFWAEV